MFPHLLSFLKVLQGPYLEDLDQQGLIYYADLHGGNEKKIMSIKIAYIYTFAAGKISFNSLTGKVDFIKLATLTVICIDSIPVDLIRLCR